MRKLKLSEVKEAIKHYDEVKDDIADLKTLINFCEEAKNEAQEEVKALERTLIAIEKDFPSIKWNEEEPNEEECDGTEEV